MVWLFDFFPQNNHTGKMCITNPEYLPIDYSFQRNIYEIVVYGTVILVLSIIGIIGNTAVILAIFKDPGLQIKNQISNITIVNLAITDVATCSVGFLVSAFTIYFDTRVLDQTFCRLQATINLGMMECSLFTMCVITIDRYVAVTKPLHYHQLMSEKRLIIMCGVCWVSFVNAGILSAGLNNGNWIGYDYAAGICEIRWIACPDSFYWIVWNYSWCAAPMPIIIFLNFKIVTSSKGEKQGDGKEAAVNAKVLKSMMIVVIAFVILAVPVTSTRMLKSWYGYTGGTADEYPMWLTMLLELLQLLASVVNPLIYGLFRKDFRDAFVKLFKSIYQ